MMLNLQAVEGGKLASGILIEIAIPILSQMIREGRSKEAPGHELKDSDRDKWVSCLYTYNEYYKVYCIC